MVPLTRNRCFTGRDAVLANIRQALTRDGRAGLTQVQAIAGLGSVGKTQTALEYAHRYYWDGDGDGDDTELYQSVFWIRVDTEQAIQSGYQAIAETLELPAATATEPDVITHAVKRWFATHSGWLLVLDNADVPAFVPDYLPTQGQGHVLITSRVQNLQPLGVIRPLPLDALEPKEALEFLLKRTDRENASTAERTAAETLANELGHLPLALEQASAYIAAPPYPRFQDYLTSYRTRNLELLHQSTPMFGDYHDPIATTWDINVQVVDATAPAAADLLRVSAFLHPDSIPYDLIVSGAERLGEPIQQALANANENPLAMVELLEPLTRYSLVRSEREQTYGVHRMVQAVVRKNLDEEIAWLWADRMVRMVTHAYPNADDFNNWPECERLLLHAQAAARHIFDHAFEFEAAGLLLNRLGTYFTARGQYAEAEPLFRDALTMRQQLLGEAHPHVASSMNNLALLYDLQGRYSEAEPLYRDALAMRQRLLGEAHPHVAASMNNLALLYFSQGRYSEAEPLFRDALAMRQRLLGEAHPHVAASMNNLAGLYSSQERYSEAELLFRDALALRQRLLGEAHPAVATSMNNLALLYFLQGRYSEAEPLYRDALAMRQRLLGEAHPAVANSLFNLGALRYQQGQLNAAQALLLEALPIYLATLGPDHPDTRNLQSWIDGVQTALDAS